MSWITLVARLWPRSPADRNGLDYPRHEAAGHCELPLGDLSRLFPALHGTEYPAFLKPPTFRYTVPQMMFTSTFFPLI